MPGFHLMNYIIARIITFCPSFTINRRPVHTMPEKLENGGFLNSLSKRHQMFSVHTAAEEFEKVTIIMHQSFWIWVWGGETRAKKSRDFRDVIVFKSKWNETSKPNETKRRRFQILLVNRASSKAPFSWQISVNCGPNGRTKSAIF